MIDVKTPESPGWWMQTLWKQLQANQRRLKRLDDYRKGRPPLVLGSESLQTAFYKFQHVSRSNFADLIVSALTERQAVRSIRTAAVDDDNGDSVAWSVWAANNLDVYSTDIHYDAASFGLAYGCVGLSDEDADGNRQPVIVALDPRQCTHVADPLNPMKVRAAFRLFHDPIMGTDYAILWLPGQKWTATRQRKANQPTDGSPIPVAFSPVSFEMAPFGLDSDLTNLDPGWFETSEGSVQPIASLAPDEFTGPLSETYSTLTVPVVPFGNRKGVGEFELHTDLIDRIHHMILQRIVIATLQAFRQRAITLDPAAGEAGELPTHDDAGNPIDYNDLFAADPGALWTLPVGAKIWESGVIDLTSILASVKQDVQDLAAVTKTPFPMFSSDATNQSAEGAQLTREGLVFKVEDRNKIFGRAWAQIIAIAFDFMGDPSRADVSKIIVDWQPAERYSLAEKAQADSLSASLPRAQKYRLIWGMTPAEVQIALAQSASDAMLAALSAPAPPAQPPARPAPVDAPVANDQPAD